MRIVQDEKPSPDELAHYGVKGMRWGVRREGSLGERFKGALADRNQRRTDRLNRKQPTTRMGKIAKEADLREAKAQRQRLKSGKLKVTDYLEMAGTVSVLDLMYKPSNSKG